MHTAKKLKALFQRTGIIKVAGAHDALSAKLAERAEFDTVCELAGLESLPR